MSMSNKEQRRREALQSRLNKKTEARLRRFADVLGELRAHGECSCRACSTLEGFWEWFLKADDDAFDAIVPAIDARAPMPWVPPRRPVSSRFFGHARNLPRELWLFVESTPGLRSANRVAQVLREVGRGAQRADVFRVLRELQALEAIARVDGEFCVVAGRCPA